MKIVKKMVEWINASNKILFGIAVVAFITGLIGILLFGGFEKAIAQTHGEQTQSVSSASSSDKGSGWGWGLLAAALSTGLSSIAAGIAVAMVGSAAMGAVAERPEVMGRSIIFVGLAEGIAIYGLIISIMILGKL